MLTQLPAEIWDQIFTFCPARSLISMQRVCKEFQSIVHLAESEGYLELVHPVVSVVVFDEFPETGEVIRLITEELRCSEIMSQGNNATDPFTFSIFEREIFFEKKDMNLRRVRIQIHCFRLYESCRLPISSLSKKYDWFLGIWSKEDSNNQRQQFLTKVVSYTCRPAIDACNILILDLQQECKSYVMHAPLPPTLHTMLQRAPNELHGYHFQSEQLDEKSSNTTTDSQQKKDLYTAKDLLDTLLSSIPFSTWNETRSREGRIEQLESAAPAPVPSATTNNEPEEKTIVCGNSYEFMELLGDLSFNLRSFTNLYNMYLTNMVCCDSVSIANPLHVFQKVGWYSMSRQARLEMTRRYFEECIFKPHRRGTLNDVYRYDIRETLFYCKHLDIESWVFKKAEDSIAFQEPTYQLSPDDNIFITYDTAIMDQSVITFRRVTIEIRPEFSSRDSWYGVPICHANTLGVVNREDASSSA